MNKYKYTIQQAAERLGKSKARIYQARKDLSLGERIGNKIFLLSEVDLKKIAKRIGKVGNPNWKRRKTI